MIHMAFSHRSPGFSLIELMVAIAIIGILISLVYVSFQESRMSTRDKVRQTTLVDLQLAIETYRTQTGFYPLGLCGGATTSDWVTADAATHGLTGERASCGQIIAGLVPSYINSLPNPSRPEGQNLIYRSDGNDYKLLFFEAAESSGNYITSFNDRFAACPPQVTKTGLCAEVSPNVPQRSRTYAVYSAGAADWRQ